MEGKSTWLCPYAYILNGLFCFTDPEDYDGQCECDPCNCETPGEMSPEHGPSEEEEEEEEEEEQPYIGEVSNLGRGFNLTEFMRAKEYFLTASTNSGLSVYD